MPDVRLKGKGSARSSRAACAIGVLLRSGSKWRRVLSFLISLVVVSGFSVVAVGVSVSPAFAEDGAAVIRVTGTVVVFSAPDPPTGSAAEAAAPDQVRLVTASGDQVSLVGDLPTEVTTGATFTGTAAVPGPVAASARIAAGTEVDDTSDPGKRVLQASNNLNTSLPVVSVGSVTAPQVPAQPAIAQTLDVAVVTQLTDPSSVVISDTDVASLVQTLSSYYTSQSGGGVAGVTETTGLQRFSSGNACDPNTVWGEAAAKFGHSSDWYWSSNNAAAHLVVLAPPACGSGSGLGSVGSLTAGGLIWVSYAAIGGTGTVAHEFGHNLGLEHSNMQSCPNPVVEGTVTGTGFTGGCTDTEYADYYDTMGGGLIFNGQANAQLTALNVTQKDRLGALPATDLPSVTLTSAGATSSYTLNPASAPGGLRGLRITDPQSGDVYYVEYRSGTGIDAGSIYSLATWPGYSPGVRILKIRADGSSAVLTYPTVNGATRPLYLKAGQSFTDPDSAFTLNATTTAETAAVTVELNITVAPAPAPTASPATSTGIQGATQIGTPEFRAGATSAPMVPASMKLVGSGATDGVSLAAPSEGSYRVNSNGTVSFTPLPTFTGRTTPVIVTEQDSRGITASTTYTATVTPVTPTATPATSSGAPGAAQTATPTFTPGDPSAPMVPATTKITTSGASADGKSITVPGQGNYVVNTSGTITFTPVGSFTGTATPITVVQQDKLGTSATTTYTPTVTTALILSATAAFITALYKDFLSRVPSAAEIGWWEGVLGSGAPRTAIADGFVNSTEYRLLRINAAYNTILGRPSDPGGVQNWLSAMNAGVITTDDIETSFYASQEYYQQHGNTDTGFVASLYQTLLHRTGAASEYAYWTGLVHQNGRAWVIAQFWDSTETISERVSAMYQLYLGRTPDAQGLAGWVSVALQIGDSGLRAAITSSQEYFNRAQTR